MELYIVRHSETVWNKERRLQGRSDIELTEYGRELARITGEALKNIDFEAIYSSPLERAYETANLIKGDKDIPIIKENRIIEISFGEYEGHVDKELVEAGTSFVDFFDHPEKYIPGKNGESLQELRKRAEDFICSLKDMYGETDKKIMIVGHGAMNKALMMVVKDSHDYSQFWSGGLQRNCNVIIIEYKNEMFRIIDEGRIYYER